MTAKRAFRRLTTLAEFRKVTTMVRPPGKHGCKPVELVPGLFTAHYEEILDRNALNKCATVLTFASLSSIFSTILRVDILPEGPEKDAARAALPKFPPEECAGDAKKDFELFIAVVDQTKAQGGATVVHCLASLSRSVAFALAYIMKSEKMSLLEAGKFMKAKWDAVWPANTFVEQLIEYEKELFGLTTLNAFRKVTTMIRPKGTHGCKPVEVAPGLYTAHYEDILDANALRKVSPNIKTVFNAAADKCPAVRYGPNVRVIILDLLDDPEDLKHVDILPEGPEKDAARAALPIFPPEECAGNAKKDFELFCNVVEETKAQGGATVVHCLASLSRSVAFALAYIMKSEKVSLLEAGRRMKAKWDAVWPANTFVEQLIEYELELSQEV